MKKYLVFALVFAFSTICNSQNADFASKNDIKRLNNQLFNLQKANHALVLKLAKVESGGDSLNIMLKNNYANTVSTIDSIYKLVKKVKTENEQFRVYKQKTKTKLILFSIAILILSGIVIVLALIIKFKVLKRSNLHQADIEKLNELFNAKTDEINLSLHKLQELVLAKEDHLLCLIETIDNKVIKFNEELLQYFQTTNIKLQDLQLLADESINNYSLTKNELNELKGADKHLKELHAIDYQKLKDIIGKFSKISQLTEDKCNKLNQAMDLLKKESMELKNEKNSEIQILKDLINKTNQEIDKLRIIIKEK